MGAGKTKQSQSAQSTSTQAFDPAIESALLGNVGTAQNTANSLTPFTGQRVAGFNDTQKAAQTGLLNVANSNVGGGLLSAAGQAATGAATYQPPSITTSAYKPSTITAPAQAGLTTAAAANAGPVAQASAANIDRGAVQNVATGPVNADQISAYFNPYQSSVVDATNADLNRQRQIEQVGNAAAATKAHAFGGTGAAVLSSLTNDNFTRQTASADANLRSTGYNTALAAAQADAARKLTADQGNQGADLSVAGQNAGLLNSTNQFNAGATNTSNQFNAGLLNTVNLANASAGNQNDQFNAGQKSSADLSNQQATNAASQFNASQDLAAQQANQSAGLDANGQAIQAAGLLGNLSNEQQSQAITNAGLLGQVGDAQQAQQQKELQGALDAYTAGQQLTLQQQQVINAALALLPTGALTQASSSSKGKSNSFDTGISLSLSN